MRRLISRAILSGTVLLGLLAASCQSFAGLDGSLSTSSNSGTNARVAPCTTRTSRSCRQSSLTRFMTATSSSSSSNNQSRSRHKTDYPPHDKTNNDFDSLLQDAQGSMNRELAEQFYKWEQDMRRRNSLAPLEDVSMRSGLRWVQEAATKQLSLRANSNNRQGTTSHSHVDAAESALYSDLVQEGLSALLQAMSTYDSSHVAESWDDYAQRRIAKAIGKSLEHEEHLIQLPRAVQKIVSDAREVYRMLRTSDVSADQPVTLDQVAEQMGLSTKELEESLQWYNRYTNTKSSSIVSLESTVEISHPMLDDSDPHFVNVDDWDRRAHRSMIDTSTTRRSGKAMTGAAAEDNDDAMDILEYLDDYRETEGDDDAWIQEHEQVAGLLQDVIPDKEDERASLLDPSLDDDVLADVIRENLGSFLQTNLEPNELQIVQMTFGLEGRQPASFRQMASELKLQDKAQAVKLLETALDKLREAFRERYLEPHDESEEEDAMGTESA